jgi:hypothetical protein
VLISPEGGQHEPPRLHDITKPHSLHLDERGLSTSCSTATYSITMSANDYYNPNPHQEQPQPYYRPYNPPPLSQLPSYHSEASSHQHAQRPTDASSVSPFDAPFDDHVYPMDSQTSLEAGSTYYGQGGGGRPAAGSINSFRDDIPLRDHPGMQMKDHDTADHVYDAPAAPPHMMEEARPNRKSGLGYFKSGKKIAWICYIMTTIQVGVFIGEIVKNGMRALTC